MISYLRQRKLVVFLILVTLFRIWLGLKIPLYLQVAPCDDFLFVKYAVNLLHGNWLGDFEPTILSKGASFSFFLAAAFALGIPYTFALIFSYIVAAAFLTWTLKNFVNSPRFLSALYVFLIYSPVMFHEENVQKVYRGGVIVIFALLVFAAFTLILAKARENKSVLLKSSVLAGVILSFFWFLKEDSIWIMPFVIIMLMAAAGSIYFSRDENFKVKLMILILPLLILAASIFAYSEKNYLKYGEFAITDRTGTYQSKVFADLLTIKDDLTYPPHLAYG